MARARCAGPTLCGWFLARASLALDEIFQIVLRPFDLMPTTTRVSTRRVDPSWRIRTMSCVRRGR